MLLENIFRAMTLILSVFCASMASGQEFEQEAKVQISRSLVFRHFDDDRDLLADLYLPSQAGPFPTLLMIHGGAWFAGNKAHVAYHAEYAAQRGYAVFAINYRLAPKHKFPAQLEDCRLALQWIRENATEYRFDTDRIGVYGYSAGGHLACLTAYSQNNSLAVERRSVPKIQAVVAGGAPCEFSWIPKRSRTLAYWIGGSREAEPLLYKAASPIEFADKDDPPLFLFHGTKDKIVPQSSPTKLQQRLKALAVVNEVYVLNDKNHIQAFLDKSARRKAVDFLDRHLAGVALESDLSKKTPANE